MRYFGNNIKLLVNNLVVSYTDHGSEQSPVIIFIHGFPLNKTMWDNQVNALKEDYRVISYDIRGHGESDIGTDDFSIELFVTDLLHLMEELKIEKASLCGLSMGGYIALLAIEKYPERFDALVLCDTNCIADPPQVKQKRLDTIQQIKSFGVERYVNNSIENLFAPQSFSGNIPAISDVKEMILNTTELSLSKTLLALSQRKETCSKLSEITLPVHFVVGEEDKITPPKAAEVMQQKIKNSTMHIISHAGHLSNLESPDEFNEQLKTFFAAVYNKPEDMHSPGSTSVFSQIRQRLNMLLTFSSI
ncbi:MAG: alpha/beta fold hydrolase [Paludibacter sp.]|nr:alpha/beta fold hydrolase [Paludibacter sp.]